MRKIWNIKEPNPGLSEEIASLLNISKVTAQLLINRGIDNPQQAADFLKCSLSSCCDPFLLKDMDKAVSRIKTAMGDGERIVVYGDYDVDGMTGSALLYSALRNVGAHVTYYIPNRLEEGYSLNVQAIKNIHNKGAALIITVDCGITSFREVEYASSLGIDVIITDHHEVLGGRVPPAYAVINPLQEGCSYPFKHLAGVGLAYKLIKALYDETPFFAEDFLDLVSLGTVADVAPLIGENRVLTKYGLNELNTRSHTGLKALMDVARLTGKDLSSSHIGFILGPRINAMGRTGSPYRALELLLSEDFSQALSLAKMMDVENKNRQKIESRILEEALSRVEREVNFRDHRVIVLASENWHPGVIGIVASRIADRFYRPAILISLDGKLGKGSGRSIENFHLFEYLLRCKDSLVGFGGHESACGVTIEKSKIDEFRNRINEEAFKGTDDDLFSPRLDIDMDIPLNAISEDVIDQINNLAPFGVGNPRPVLASRRLLVKEGPRQIGKGGFKMLVSDNNVICEAVSFGRGNIEPPAAGSTIDAAYIPSINDWQGFKSIQLEIKDIA